MREFLEKNCEDGMSESRAIKLCVKALLEVVDSGAKNMEICLVCTHITRHVIVSYCTMLSNAMQCRWQYVLLLQRTVLFEFDNHQLSHRKHFWQHMFLCDVIAEYVLIIRRFYHSVCTRDTPFVTLHKHRFVVTKQLRCYLRKV
jgi:hypothetical protein